VAINAYQADIFGMICRKKMVVVGNKNSNKKHQPHDDEWTSIRW
jgi:hypothetical protein